jgi:hypothetical protein
VRSELFGFLAMSSSDDSSVDSDDSSVEDYEQDDVEVLMRQALSKSVLQIEWDEDYGGIFADVDAFLELSKGNSIVQVVCLNPYWYQNRIRRSDANWEEKLGRALGNLQSLTVLSVICTDERDEDLEGEYEQEPPDWEYVARVLRHIRQKITLCVCVSRQHAGPRKPLPERFVGTPLSRGS